MPGLVAGAALVTLAIAPYAHATVIPGTPVEFTLNGPSAGGGTISASGTFTIVPDTVTGDPAGAYAITAINGTFSDSNPSVGLNNEAISGLVAINPVVPTPSGVQDDASFSRFTATGPAAGFVSYDNLFFWSNGAPIVCVGYSFSGGFVTTYGALFTLANGDTVNFWSNGGSARPPSYYGITLLSPDGSTVLDASPIPPHGQDPSGITASVPEPGSLALFATALLIGGLAWRRKTGAAVA